MGAAGGALATGRRGHNGWCGEQYLVQRKTERLVTQRRESNDDGRARRGCRGFDGDGSSVPSLPRRCSNVHWTVNRVVGGASDRRIKKQAEEEKIAERSQRQRVKRELEVAARKGLRRL